MNEDFTSKVVMNRPGVATAILQTGEESEDKDDSFGTVGKKKEEDEDDPRACKKEADEARWEAEKMGNSRKEGGWKCNTWSKTDAALYLPAMLP